jgi:small subunit ribosomal protein S6
MPMGPGRDNPDHQRLGREGRDILVYFPVRPLPLRGASRLGSPKEVRPLRLYEVMVIFHPGQEAEAVRTAVDRLDAVVTERGGSISRTEIWGRRRFAYEVNHVKDGTYVVLETAASPEAVAELDRVLSITDEVLRHKVVRLPDTGIPAVVPATFEDSAPDTRSPRGEGGRDERK